MKNLKLSFALIVAILAVGVTVATQASFGKRVITRCFWDIDLVSATGVAGSIDAFQTPRLSCSDARLVVTGNGTTIPAKPYLTAAAVATSFPDNTSCPAVQNFCCAKVTEMLPGETGYAQAQFLDLGEGLKKYKIANASLDIFCKVN